MTRTLAALLLWPLGVPAQVYSPVVLSSEQPDPTDLRRLAQGIYRLSGATTERERAEAVWRYFLTDGRFVAPGFWYHIAGWAYEEPMGEVLDPMKLLNSYGFGLCYQVAPLLEAVWKAGGFQDARVWFLTGHTVAEVFYEGGYHYFDSDMMGYNVTGAGTAGPARVASVHDIELAPSIITETLAGQGGVNAGRASNPWYPADVRAGAIPDLADLFSTTADNRLFRFDRSPQGHTMDFVLRPGERLVRHFRPARDGLFYLPHKWTGERWEEFPRELSEYSIRTEDGPASQKDGRRWATGELEYRPPVSTAATGVYDVHSPYVIIDAGIQMSLALGSAGDSVQVATSIDDGRTWTAAGSRRGPYQGAWRVEPAVLARTNHGRRTHVSGQYGYLVRVIRSPQAGVSDLLLRTRIQLNPRTLPELHAGKNSLVFAAGTPRIRREMALEPSKLREAALSARSARFVTDGAQGYWLPEGDGAEFVFRLTGGQGRALTGFDAGGRFLDLGSGLAPDKFTAEVRAVASVPSRHAAASIAWSESAAGPFHPVWEFAPNQTWLDGRQEDRLLVWPEVDRHVEAPAHRELFVRYRFSGMALDQVRLAADVQARGETSELEVRHLWTEQGQSRSFVRRIPAGVTQDRYSIELPADAHVTNDAIIFECKAANR